MKARYEIEPSTRISGCEWVAAYNEKSELICTPVSYRSHDTALWVKGVYEAYDAEHGEVRRGLLPELKYEPYIVEIMEKQIHSYVNSEICAGELAREAHEVRKALRHTFGTIPDTKKRDELSAFDTKTADDRRAYVDELIPNWEETSHILQKQPIQRWIEGQSTGAEFWQDLLYLEAWRSDIAYMCPG